ncbi:MAG: helix-turn-helix domain-containing protein [Acidimicrobiales bacterium]
MKPERVQGPVEGPGDQGGAGGGGDPGGLQEVLIQAANLSGSEARVLAALLGLRTATLKQLSEAADFASRSNLYPILESLSAKGLCQRLPGKYAIWQCPEPEEVLGRLQRAEEARLDAAREAAGRGFDKARRMLAGPSAATEDPPIILDDDARSATRYQEAMESVEGELLVLNRGPYPGDLVADPGVLEALARGVKARALYISAELDAPDGQLRVSAETYAEAGVETRVVDSLPVAMAVIGEETVLLSLPNRDVSSPVAAHAAAIRHEGMVELASAAFERLWDEARPFGGAGAARTDLRIVEPDGEMDGGGSG